MASPDRVDKRKTRDKLRTLAERELNQLKGKAKRVFRDEPETLREYSSAWRRKVNARAYRLRKAREEQAARDAGATNPPVDPV